MTDVTLKITGLLLLLGVYAAILPSWRRGLEFYILFIPFAGALDLLLYPAPWAVLIKDVLFAVPAYLGFAISGELGFALSGLPRSLGWIVLIFGEIVLAQALNPDGPGLLATLIGLKVWLFYVPMVLLGRAYVRDRKSLLRLSRLMTCLVWLPCLVGITQWLLSLAFGYQDAIRLFYGVAAEQATQQFASFDNGLMRIPSTFSFPSQYLNYILCMFVPVLGCTAIEIEPVWQKLRSISLALLCVAGFMSGSRSAFIVIPLTLFAFYTLRRGALGLLWAGLLMTSLFAMTLFISRVDLGGLIQMETELSQNYASGEAEIIEDALGLTWIGRGVGSNTGAARFATEDPTKFTGFESYYGKTITELGLAGLSTVILFQVGLLLWALRLHADVGQSPTAHYIASMAAFFLVFMIYNYKGFLIDLDPANMLYWLFAGVLFSLPRVEMLESRPLENVETIKAFALS